MPKIVREMPEIGPTAVKGPPEAEPVDDIDFVPTTEFGRRLLELRRRAIADGLPLLTRAELEREVAERRSGVIDRDER